MYRTLRCSISFLMVSIPGNDVHLYPVIVDLARFEDRVGARLGRQFGVQARPERVVEFEELPNTATALISK